MQGSYKRTPEMMVVIHSTKVKVATNVCHNTHYLCVVMFTTNFVVNVTTMYT